MKPYGWANREKKSFFLFGPRGTGKTTLIQRTLPDVTMSPAPLASVTIDSGYKTYLDGKEISPEEIAAALSTILGDAPAGQRNVFLKVHREAKASHFEPVIAAISEAGGDLIHILEPEEESTTP